MVNEVSDVFVLNSFFIEKYFDFEGAKLSENQVEKRQLLNLLQA